MSKETSFSETQVWSGVHAGEKMNWPDKSKQGIERSSFLLSSNPLVSLFLTSIRSGSDIVCLWFSEDGEKWNWTCIYIPGGYSHT